MLATGLLTRKTTEKACVFLQNRLYLYIFDHVPEPIKSQSSTGFPLLLIGCHVVLWSALPLVFPSFEILCLFSLVSAS